MLFLIPAVARCRAAGVEVPPRVGALLGAIVLE